MIMQALTEFIVHHPVHFYIILVILCITAIACCDRLSPYENDDEAPES